MSVFFYIECVIIYLLNNIRMWVMVKYYYEDDDFKLLEGDALLL